MKDENGCEVYIFEEKMLALQKKMILLDSPNGHLSGISMKGLINDLGSIIEHYENKQKAILKALNKGYINIEKAVND